MTAEPDLTTLRELAAEFGYTPATTNPEDIERHRRLNKALDAAPDLEKTMKKFAHLHLEWLRRQGEAAPGGNQPMLAMYVHSPYD